GTYSYTIYANNTLGQWSNTSTYTFNLYHYVKMQLRTMKDIYMANETINLTDPPEKTDMVLDFSKLMSTQAPATTNTYVTPKPAPAPVPASFERKTKTETITPKIQQEPETKQITQSSKQQQTTIEKEMINKWLFVKLSKAYNKARNNGIAYTFTKGIRISHITIKNNPIYDVTINSAEMQNNAFVVVFHHNSAQHLPISVTGSITNYTLSKTTSKARENVTLTIPNWNNKYFRIKVGEQIEVIQFGQQKELNFNAAVKDSTGSQVDATVEFIDTDSKQPVQEVKPDTSDTKVNEGTYDIKITPTDTIDEILIHDVNIDSNITKFIDIDNVENTEDYVKVYAIDPTGFNFTNATVTVTATGTKLYKCKQWNFSTQTCFGEWALFKDNLIPGKEYTFTLTPEDPGFGETLDIINVQSYPTVGGNWTVEFTTTGTADLYIRASNSTTWSNTDENEDLKFLTLKCGDQTVSHIWVNNSVYVQDYSCSNTAQETSKVITEGVHDLQFTFGSETEYAHNFAGKAIAFLQGDTLEDGTANINVATLNTLNFSTSNFDTSYFSHPGNDAKLTVLQDGDYFIALTIPQNRSDVVANTRSCVEAQVLVNNVKQPVGTARSSYIRSQDLHYYSSDHLAVLLKDLTANDEITIKVQGVADTTQIVNSYTGFSLYAEYIADTETIFSATGTESNDTTSPTNLNQATEYFMKWAENRKDTGMTHNDATSPEAITLDSIGKYFVTVNIPFGSAAARPIVEGRVRLDGQIIDGGLFRQTYIRNSQSHSDSSGHWAGLVETTSTNQVLTIGVIGVGNNIGTSMTTDNENATIFIQKMPPTGIYQAEATQVTGATPDDWNPASPEEIIWATDNIIDTSSYTHSTGTNPHIITVDEDGQYLVALNGAFRTTGARESPRMNIKVNEVPQPGAWSQTGYIRDQSGDEESSDSLVFLLDLTANDNISVTMSMDTADATIVDEDTPTTIMIWKKTAAAADEFPSVTLDQPTDNYINDTNQYVNITFNATATDDNGLLNCSLWHNISGTFELNQTQPVSGTNNETQFTLNLTNTSFIWNIYCYDDADQLNSTNANRTVILNWTEPIDEFPYWSNNQTDIVPTFSPTTQSYFNITW
ncbi:hypothetical protein ACFLYT_01590, partial [Nanoarchaeota archaeon]